MGFLHQRQKFRLGKMSEPGGDAMVTAAYQGRSRALRRLNRTLSTEILGFSN